MLHIKVPNYPPEVNPDDYAFLLRDLRDARAQLASTRKELAKVRSKYKDLDFDYRIQLGKNENLERKNGNLRSLVPVKQASERRRQAEPRSEWTYFKTPPANN